MTHGAKDTAPRDLLHSGDLPTSTSAEGRSIIDPATGAVIDTVPEQGRDAVDEFAETDLSPTVERALETSPAIAAMLNAAEGAFALFVNGRSVPVAGVPQSAAPTQTDPFPAALGAAPSGRRPRAEPERQTTRPPGRDRGASLTDNQSGAVGWRVQARGSYDLDTRLVESTVGFPGLAAAETWNLVSDASNEAAPSGLAYFSAGTAFCYHTQLCRYADVRRMEIASPRLVQVSDFSSSNDGGGVVDAVDTQLFLNGSLDADAASSLLIAAANTCYAHRALGVAIERPTAVVTTSTGVSLRTFNTYFAGKYEAVAFRQTDRMRQSLAAFRERPADEPLWSAITEAVLAPLEAEAAADLRPTHEELAEIRDLLSARDLRAALSRDLVADWVDAIAERTGTDPARDMYPRLVAAVIRAVGETAMEVYANADPPVAFAELLRRGFADVAAGLPER